jgi:uncharacterized protein (TIGR02444 family)
MLELDNSFWKFSVSVYDEHGVAQECLTFQDTQGLDVNVLLFCAWVGSVNRRMLTDAEFLLIEKQAEVWQAQVVTPLRLIRRRLKASFGDDARVKNFRSEITRAELLAEQIEQAELFENATPRGSGPITDLERATRHNVATLLNRRGLALGIEAIGPPAAERLVDASIDYGRRLLRPTGTKDG